MNEKWADYVITSVSYNSTHTHIVAVEAKSDLGAQLGPRSIFRREQVVNMLKGGSTFVTVVLQNGKWHRGQSVHIVVINGQDYIRTDRNQKESDNLEGLPELQLT